MSSTSSVLGVWFCFCLFVFVLFCSVLFCLVLFSFILFCFYVFFFFFVRILLPQLHYGQSNTQTIYRIVLGSLEVMYTTIEKKGSSGIWKGEVLLKGILKNYQIPIIHRTNNTTWTYAVELSECLRYTFWCILQIR